MVLVQEEDRIIKEFKYQFEEMSGLFAQFQIYLTIFKTDDFYHYELKSYSKEFKYEIP